MRTVEQFLSDGEWHKISEITAATGVTREEMSGSGYLSEGTVISHPRYGYKLTRHASREEVAAAVGNLKSRARSMIQRGYAIRDAWERHNGKGGLAP